LALYTLASTCGKFGPAQGVLPLVTPSTWKALPVTWFR
jgi:hypothetical protein